MDIKFYEKCLEIQWITTTELGINTKFVNEHLFLIAKTHLENMENERCPVDKLKCVQKAFTILNNCIIFCSGKKDGGGVDDIMPMLIYIIIKAKQKKMYSNFQFIKAMIHPRKLLANYGFVLSQVEVSMEYIMNLNHETLKITEEEFLRKSSVIKTEGEDANRRKGLSKLSNVN